MAWFLFRLAQASFRLQSGSQPQSLPLCSCGHRPIAISDAEANKKSFISSIPTLKPLLHKKCNVSLPPPQLSSLQHCKCAARILILCCWALQGYSALGHCRDTFRLGTAGILVVGHCRDTLLFGTTGILTGSALQGYFAVGHYRDASWLGTARILCDWAHPLSIAGILIGWALQEYLVVGRCRDTWWLGNVRILCGWALQGYLVVGHCSQLPVGRGQHLL